MSPAARVAAAIELLDRWEAAGARMEPLLRDWGRANRYAGSGDRRAIADLAYEALRKRRSLALASGAAGGRGLLHGLLLARGEDPATIFSGARHAPAPLTASELSTPAGPPPDPVRLDHPDWLEAPLKASLGPRYEPSLLALRERAPVDLRVNRTKATREAARAALAGDGIEAAPLPMPDALRAPPGAPIARSRAFLDGLVEPQDEASQEAAAFAAPRPGETILDFCAGGGGKALAFASLAGGGARILAHDALPARMRDLPARAARAGARIEIVGPSGLAPVRGACDLVFVDAPCSGSGTWRRDPEAKWRLTPERLVELEAAQRRAAREALPFLAPGGRLAFATCSILDGETREAAAAIAAETGLRLEAELRRLPDEGSDGFYCAILTRRG